MHQLSQGPYSPADVNDTRTTPLHRTHQHVTDHRSLNLDSIHEYSSTQGQPPRANILIATPFMNAAAYLEKYFQTLTDINYPKELISLAFLVSTVAKDESQDATLVTLNEHVSKLVSHSQYRRITVIQQKAAPSNYTHHQRHQYEFQESRRKELARCRNALLASALVDESWVLWLDVDIVEYSPDLLQILMNLDKDIVVPNCLRSRSTLWRTEGVPYDRNNWMETAESLASQRVLEDEEVLFEGYERDHPTYRQSMADLDRDNQSLVVLDGVGGTFTLIKALVHLSSTSTLSTVSVTTTTAGAVPAPLSALAARRQKLLAGDSKASTPEVEEHLEVDNLDVDEEEKASLDSYESGDDDSNSESSGPDEDNATDAVLPAKSPSTPQYERRDRKLYLDPQSVSSFKPSRYNVAYSSTSGLPAMMLVGMKRGETLVFQGCATVIPLIGHSTALGYILSGTAEKRRVGSKKGAARSGDAREIDLSSISSFDIFSPKTHALAVIESISLAGSQRNLMAPQRTFPTSPEIRAQLEAQLAQLTLGDYDTIIAIQSASGCGILGIEKVVPLFKGILSIKQNSRLRGNEDEDRLAQVRFESSLGGFHPILEPTDGIAALQIPTTWKDAIQALINATVDENGGRVKRPPVSVVCGGKKMGKSTFSRLVLNRMLNRDDPDYYMACIKELVRTYYAEVSHTRSWDDADDDYHSDDDENEHIPLVINTQGWIKGMGYDLLLQLLDYTAPSHIFGFHSPSSGESNLPQSFFTTMKEQAHLAGRQQPSFSYVSAVVLGDESSASPFTKYHPADHRALALLSYFYLCQEQDMGQSSPASNDKRTWDFSQALVVRRPWCWDWNQAKGIWVLFDQVPPSQILHVLNASLVALTGDKEDRDNDGSGTLDEPHQNQPESVNDSTPGEAVPLNYFPLGQFPPPPPEHTTCHGLAIIRSIQPSTHTLHILTPIPLVKLRKCNGIVKGAIHMPIHASLDHNEDNSKVPGVAGVPWKNVPYLNYEISSSSYTNGSQSPSAGNQSPRLEFAPASKIIGANAKVIRKNLGRKRLQS
ncbi:hypothetical protein BGZ67_002092 [Mortierella alpina]|nr:hypothetical protein BGZ67_002092 [Mortierella alpina]